ILVAQHPQHRIYYWDQRLCVGTKDNELVGMFWTHDRDAASDIAVHFRRLSLNDDSPSERPLLDTGIPGQIAAPLLLDDGRIVAFVVDRSGPMTLKLWQSADGGRTWPGEKS